MPDQSDIKNPKVRAPLVELGETGLTVRTGRIYEDFLAELVWPRKNQTYKEMSMNDPTIGALLHAIEMIIRQIEWFVDPAEVEGQEEKAKEMAEFVKSCMNDMEDSWPNTVGNILTLLSYGFSVHEIVYKKRLGPRQNSPKFQSKFSDGFWGWRKLPIRAQDTIYRWAFNDDWTGLEFKVGSVNNLTGVVQKSPNNYQELQIPRDRFLLFRNNTKIDNPESESPIRSAHRPWRFKKHLEEIEAIGVEQNLVGTPVFKIPSSLMDPEATKEEKAAFEAFKEMGTSLKRNEQACVVMPQEFDENSNPLYELELLSIQGSASTVDTDKIIQRYNRDIARSLLGDFIMMGEASQGSFALSTNLMKLFEATMGAWTQGIADEFNKHALRQLWKHNGFDSELIPTLRPGKVDTNSLADVADYLSKLAKEGVIEPTQELSDWSLRRADAPVNVDGTVLKTPDEKKERVKAEVHEEMRTKDAIDAAASNPAANPTTNFSNPDS